MAQVKGDDKERREELVVEEIEAGKEGKEDPDPESTDMAAKQPPPPYEAQLPGVVETGAMPQVVIVQAGGVPSMPRGMLGYFPVQVTCPHCHQAVTTAVSEKNSLLAWVLGGVMCIIGCWPCCCIPCCISSLKDYEHFCPNCHVLIGTKRAG